MSFNIAFAGTPDFAATILSALIDSGNPPVLVLTQPDRPQGRGLKLAPSPVKQVALEHGIRVAQPATLKTPESQTGITDTPIDLLIVAAYGLLLPQAVLDWPKFGAVNAHASLLPRWRGAAPIQRAILAGDTETGVTLMKVDAGLDTGDMISVHRVAIEKDDTAGSLHDKLASVAAAAMVGLVEQIKYTGAAPGATPQPASGATYASKIAKDEAVLDWNQSAAALALAVRAFNPFPGARTSLNHEVFKIWKASALPRDEDVKKAQPGEIIDISSGNINIACGKGLLSVSEVQISGHKRMNSSSYLSGHELPAGTIFE